MRTLPMFPLGTVLFPYGVLPLHIFEDRYRELIKDCLAGDREFGVVLIERGPEVGGGDVRCTTGTTARIVEAEELPDGRWVALTAGVRRIRVVRWLADDPYPCAEVEDMPDPLVGPEAGALRDEAVRAVHRVSALRAEIGEPAAPVTLELAGDPVAASYQAATVALVGTYDEQRLLETDGAEDRLRLLLEILAAETETLERRLAEG